MKTILKFRPRGQTYLLCFALLISLSGEARAELFFTNVTNTIAENVEIGLSQLSVDVTDAGSNQVLFTFSNAGPDASSITEIYFEDGTLLALAEIRDVDLNPVLYPGLDFSQPVTPENPPGLEGTFDASAVFSVDALHSPDYGVNPSESLGLLFGLESGKNFQDVLAALTLGFTGPVIDEYGDYSSLRIAFHVKAFDLGQSETFIVTPVPGAVLLGMLGLGVAGLKLRKFG